MAGNTEWGVDSYHINVAIGDAAIHVQVHLPTNTATKCVLIDGGSARNSLNPRTGIQDPNPLRRTLLYISSIYRWPNVEAPRPPNTAQIDAIVLTHNDEDHYGGLLRTIIDDTARGLLTWYLRYDAGGNPTTRFYTPNWTWANRLNGVNSRMMSRDTAGVGYINIGYVPPPLENTSTYDWVPFCHVFCAEDAVANVLCRDIFTGFGVTNPTTINTLQVLIAQNPPQPVPGTNSLPPAMYCIGVRQTIPGPRQSFVIIENPTLTNRYSIATVIVWPQSGRVSHYFAGDVDEESEANILGWLRIANGVGHVTSIKLSHHGSKSSTPLDTMINLTPRNIFMSNPASRYTHPSWEIFVYLWVWIKFHNPMSGALPMRILATKYPHFFATLQDTLGNRYFARPDRMNLRAFAEWDQGHYPNYWTNIDSAYTLVNAGQIPAQTLSTELETYHQLVNQGWSNPQIQYWILWSIQSRWNEVAYPPEISHPGVGVGWVFPGNGPVTQNNQVDFVLIQSRDTDPADGAVGYKYLNVNQIIPYFRVDNTTNVQDATGVWVPANTLGGPITLHQYPLIRSTALVEGGEPGKLDKEDTVIPIKSGVVITGNYEDVLGTNPNELDADDQAGPGGSSLVRAPNPLPKRVIAETVPVTFDDSTGFYFYSSRITGTIPVQSYQVLPTGSEMDQFVGALHCGVICLKEQPPPSAPPGPGPQSTPFLSSDELGAWLLSTLGATDIGIIDQDATSIGGFAFAMVVPPRSTGGGAVQAATKGLALAFSTASVADNFTTTVPQSGIIPKMNILCFGMSLAAVPTDSLTLTDLIEYTGLKYLENSAVAQALGSQLVFHITADHGKRNAVWFEPMNSYKTTLRLQLALSDGEQSLISYLASLGSISFTHVDLILRKSATWSRQPDGSNSVRSVAHWDGSLTFSVGLLINGIEFDTVIELHPTQVRLELVLRSKLDVLKQIFDWMKSILKETIKGDNFDFVDWLEKKAASIHFDGFFLRRIMLTLDHTATNAAAAALTAAKEGSPSLVSFSIDIELRFMVNGQVALFLVSYDWQKGGGSTLDARLWCSAPESSKDQVRFLLPDYEEYQELSPVSLKDGESWPWALDLKAAAGWDSLPDEIPNELTQASAMIGSGGLAIAGKVMCDPTKHVPGKVPSFYLGELDFSVSFEWGQSVASTAAARSGFAASLGMTAMLQPPADAANQIPAQLTGGLLYANNRWALSACLTNLYGGNLYQLFDKSTRGGIVSVLDRILVKELNVNFAYSTGGGAKSAASFTSTGVLVLGALELDLTFNYESTGGFEFTAVLKVDTEQATSVGRIAADILGGDVELPAFLANVDISLPKDQNLVGFTVSSHKVDGSEENGVIFLAWIDYKELSLEVVQYQGPPPQKGKQRPPARRFIAVSFGNVKPVKIPLIGDLTRPFDEILCAYVQPHDGEDASAGFTRRDLKFVNDELAKQKPPRRAVMVKDTKKPDQAKDTDVLLAAGGHFILVLRNDKGVSNVALDYRFLQPKSKSGDERSLVVAANEQPPTDPGSSKAPYKKTIGPLTIQNMGIKFSTDPSPTVSVVMDASIVLGPIGLALLGFQVNFIFKDASLSLQNLPSLSFSIAGLAASFNRDPVILAGMFAHIITIDPETHSKTDAYEGALTIAFTPYLFQAAGYYGKTTQPPPKSGFTSVFVYAILNGPLVTLEFAQIEGVCGGFGYNTNLTFPSVQNVTSFPFIAVPSTSSPQDTISQLTSGIWFFPQQNCFWLAAGLTVLAFEILAVQAVVVVEWDPAVKLGLFGLATADMPAGKNQKIKFVHVQLGLVATIDFGAGVMKIEGQLTPASFILNPFCHLSGGFAFYSWFNSADPALRGDWVFTIGGFHQGFQKPQQYPNPPRLAITWAFDSAISIRGEAYFAITPHVCMGGGRLDASLSLGPLHAWFNAYTDFLINYKPFHFTAEGGLSVGVKFTLDLWIVTIHINVEIGATLYIEGPPMAGRVHVDFWVFGFDINFGHSEGGIDKLTLDEFFNLVLQQDIADQRKAQNAQRPQALLGAEAVAPAATATPTPTRARITAAAEDEDDVEEEAASEGSPPPHVFSCNNGLVPNGDQSSTPDSATERWKVRGAVFQFSVGCKFAIDSASIQTAVLPGSGEKTPDPVAIPALPNTLIWSKPMNLGKDSPLSSTLTVTITPEKDAGFASRSTKVRLWQHVVSEDEELTPPIWDSNDPIIRSVPRALWDYWDPSTDPSSPSNPNPNNSSLLSGSSPSMALMMGVSLTSPKPKLSSDKIPAFDVATEFTEDVEPPITDPPPEHAPKHFSFPQIDSAQPLWYPDPLPDPAPPDYNPWDDARALWLTPGLGQNAGQQVLALWRQLSFCNPKANPGWTTPAAAAAATAVHQPSSTSIDELADALPTDPISGQPPARLLTGKDAEDGGWIFDSTFLECPRSSVFVV